MSTRRSLLLALAGLLAPAAATAATPPKKKAPAKKPLVITINKVSQKMTVSLDGRTKYKWPVSTGAPGYDTPSGNLPPLPHGEGALLQANGTMRRCRIRSSSPARGHAVHGSYHVKSLGRRASHGCVRLHPDNAAKLFALVKQTGMSNTQVVVKGGFFDTDFIDDDLPLFKKKSTKKPGKRKLFPWELGT